MKDDVVVLGSGAFGMALSCVLSLNGFKVRLLPKFERELESLRATRQNSMLFGDFKIPENVLVGPSYDTPSDCMECLENATAIFFVIPNTFAFESCEKFRGFIPPKSNIIICSKGIIENPKTKEIILLSDVMRDLLDAEISVLSGPNFASEIAKGMISATVMASRNLDTAKKNAKLIHSKNFKVEITDDIVGVQIAGAFKNVLAIACGITIGANLGENAKSTVVYKGVNELCDIISKMGGLSQTMLGLSGIGDLTLTCFSESSRNTAFGKKLGQKESLKELLSKQNKIVEGYFTAKHIQSLIKKIDVRAPLFEAIHKILYCEADPIDTIVNILTRD